MFRVILKLNAKVLKELTMDQNEIIVGRDTTCDIQIDNIAVSREHATIIKGPNYYFIEDMGSKNGTFVNGKKINKKFLKADDEVIIGKHCLQIILDEDAAVKKKKNVKGIDSTYRMGAAEYKRIMSG
jgi:pSer/pThr/pTyr-binding forkhead associated (FHA) protein